MSNFLCLYNFVFYFIGIFICLYNINLMCMNFFVFLDLLGYEVFLEIYCDLVILLLSVGKRIVIIFL